MNMKRLVILLLLVVLSASLASTATAQDSAIATIIFQQEPDTLSPLYTGMWFSSITTDLWLAGAWNFDADLNPNPVLVTEIPSTTNGGVSEDGLTITLNLRDDIVWSDGEPITSADFVFTYEMWIAEGNLVSSAYPYDTFVDSVEAPDALTFIVNFNAPFAPWLATMWLTILPEHILAPVYADEGSLDYADWNREPIVSSGPFVFSEWESGGHIFFERNENYYNGDVGLDGVFIRIVEDDAAVVAALVNGDADLATFIAYSDLGTLEGAGIDYSLANSGYNEQWTFNVNPETAHPAMLELDVRKALTLAAPIELVNETLNEDRTFAPSTSWEGTPYDNPDIAPPGYDPEAAAALLDGAGWVDSDGDGIRDKDGVDLELRYLTPPRQVRMDTQVVVQQAYAELGIGLILENPSYDIFWTTYGEGGPIATGAYDIGQWSNSPAFPDPDMTDFLCAEIPNEENLEGNNWTGFCNEEVDSLLQEQAITTDFDARVAMFHRIGELVTENAIWMGVWYDPDIWAINPRVLNVAISGAAPFWNASTWEIAQ
jgi:peptide/nickel transport system substrate-binding protein